MADAETASASTASSSHTQSQTVMVNSCLPDVMNYGELYHYRLDYVIFVQFSFCYPHGISDRMVQSSFENVGKSHVVTICC